MESIIKELSKLSIPEILLGIEYGKPEVVKYDSEDTRNHLLHVFQVANKIAGADVLREDVYFENVPTDSGWDEVPVEGVYRLIYADKNNPVPVPTEDDINLVTIIETMSYYKESVGVVISPAMVKTARKLCKDAGVKFIPSEGGYTIDGQEKAISVYKQIQKAYKDGLANVSFNLEEINMPTVRTYASQFGSAISKKLRCSVIDGTITVHFRELTPEEAFENDIAAIVQKAANAGLEYSQVHDAVTTVINRAFYTEVFETQGVAAQAEDIEPMWAQMGFESESEYIEYEERKKADVEAWVSPEPTTAGQPEDALPPGVEIVEGLPQYVISGFETAIAETAATLEEKLPEDDDF
jgi:DNA-binding transcriptional regulator YhcF (GntR family)